MGTEVKKTTENHRYSHLLKCFNVAGEDGSGSNETHKKIKKRLQNVICKFMVKKNYANMTYLMYIFYEQILD